MGESESLFEGGDCEDCAQRVYQIIYCISKHTEELCQLLEDKLQCETPGIRDVFAAISSLTSCVYIARGVYYDEELDKDGNHTFCVVGHTGKDNYHFSIVECVSAVLIIHNKDDAACAVIGETFENALSEQKTPLAVLNKTSAAHCYKHILWVDMYMVFEYVHDPHYPGGREMLLSFGAASYFDYTSGFFTCIYNLRVFIEFCEA